MVCYPTYGGSGVIAVELAQGLAARGHEVHLISLALPVRLRQFSRGLYFHEVRGVAGWPFDHSWYDVALTNLMVGLARSVPLDLVHVHYAMPHAVSAYLAKQILRRERLRLPVVTTLHGTDVFLVADHPSFERVMRFVMLESDGLTAVSQYLAALTRRQLALPRSIEVIPNGVDTEVFRPGPAARRALGAWGAGGAAPIGRSGARHRLVGGSRKPMLMHVSNFRPLKRVVDVVEIFCRVRRIIPATLVMVGDGPDYERVERLVKARGLEEDVVLLGKQDAVHTLLPCADVFLLPSAQESFGLAALEAMACGVPVVASRVGGLPEVVRHGVDGWLEPPGDVEQHAARCVDLLQDRALARRMGAAARRRAVKTFATLSMVAHYEHYYRSLTPR